MGDPANFITLTYSEGSYGPQDTSKVLAGLKYNLNHWLGLHMAATYLDSEGTVTLPWDEIEYATNGVGDLAFAVTADLTGRTKFTPCPVDGNFLPIKDFLHIMAMAGTSFPTGKYTYENDYGLYPSEYQLGTGTYDPFVGAALFKRWGRWQPQLTTVYKFSGGKNDANYWRGDALLSKLDLIYFINPYKKITVLASITHSRVSDDERDYSWGTEDMYLEVTGTSGNTTMGTLAWGMEIIDRLRINLAWTTSIQEPDSADSAGKSIGDQYSVGFGYRFGK